MGWRWRRLATLCMVLAICVPSAAHAENLGPGGGTRVIAGDETFGPYRLFVTSSPAPAQTGKVTFVARITDPKTGATVKDADVRVSLSLPDTDVRLDAAATHQDAGNPVDYAAHVQIDQPGQYDGVLRVSAAAGPTEITFVQPVMAPRSTSMLLILALPFVAALVILGGFWYFRFGSRNASRH
jgi:hypothetical protein